MHQQQHLIVYHCPGKGSKYLLRECESVAFRVDRVDAAVWRELRTYLSHPQLLEQALAREANTGEVERVEARLDGIAREIAERQGDMSKLLDLYLDGRYGREALISKQREIEQTIERLEVERSELSRQLDDAVARQEQAKDARRFAEEVAAGLLLADGDFKRWRWYVDVLDVTARLEHNEGRKLVHIYVGGHYLVSTSIAA